jgi:DNA-binding CsgD family transcriptional regulator
MPGADLFLQTIETVYASGLDSDRLPEALETTSRLLGSAAATLEVFDKSAQRHDTFYTVGVPTVARASYLDHFATCNPRMPFILRQRANHVAWDHQILDEAGMRHDPFYSEFLSHIGLRYFLGAVLEHTPEKIALVSVQRTRKQGHVDNREIALMRRLFPHYQRAHDMMTRLKVAGDHRGLLENTLDWLTDGIALLRADGDIVHANHTLRTIAQRGDGIRILDRAIEFVEPDAQRRFGAALGAVQQVGDPSCDARPTDFPVPRSSGMPAYIVSVRPLVCGQTRAAGHAQAVIMVLIRDPLWRNAAASRILQELFSLTNAEAHLAQALCNGTTTGTYAVERHVSLNTVYSHLKRIREKTGCKSVPELIRKFGELNVPLRVSVPPDSA